MVTGTIWGLMEQWKKACRRSVVNGITLMMMMAVWQQSR